MRRIKDKEKTVRVAKRTERRAFKHKLRREKAIRVEHAKVVHLKSIFKRLILKGNKK
jgi:hypothetical protein